MRKEFLIMITFYVAGLVFVNYKEPLSQTTCYVTGWLLMGGCKKKMSKELTDDFLNKKLQAGSFYFIKTENGRPEPMVVDIDGDFNDYEGNYYKPEFSKGKLEVLALCDYNHFVELTEKVKEIERKQRFINARNSPVYREETYRLQKASIDELTSLLKECQKYFRYMTSSDMPLDTSFDYMDVKLLDRINAEIGESGD